MMPARARVAIIAFVLSVLVVPTAWTFGLEILDGDQDYYTLVPWIGFSDSDPRWVTSLTMWSDQGFYFFHRFDPPVKYVEYEVEVFVPEGENVFGYAFSDQYGYYYGEDPGFVLIRPSDAPPRVDPACIPTAVPAETESVLITGVASDDWWLETVEFSLNGGEWAACPGSWQEGSEATRFNLAVNVPLAELDDYGQSLTTIAFRARDSRGQETVVGPIEILRTVEVVAEPEWGCENDDFGGTRTQTPVKRSGSNSLDLAMTYRSDVPRVGPFGLGSSHGYDSRLVPIGDDAARVVARRPCGRRTEFVRNPDGTYTPTHSDGLDLSHLPDGTWAMARRDGLTYFYRADGVLASAVDRNGNRTIPTYDSSGRLTDLTDDDGNHQVFAYRDGLVSSVTDQGGSTVMFAYETVGGSPVLAAITRGGVETRFTYDQLGRRTAQVQDTDGDGSAETVVAEWSYEPSGRTSTRMVRGQTVASTVNYRTGLIQRTDSLGRTSLTSTNADQLPILAVDALGHERRFAYDATTRKWTYERDALGRERRFDHDARGNLVWAQNPDGTAATATYTTTGGAERPVEVRNELGVPTFFEYDDRANCTAVINALGQRAETTFDSRGHPVTRRDPAGAVTTMTWNDQSNLVAVRDALGNERSSTFDVIGNEIAATDKRGNQTERQFDDLRRVVAETLPADASGERATVNYVYDGEGRVVRSIDAKGNETVFTHDGYGRLVATTDSLGHVTTNTWDEAGRLVETKDARGNVTHFQHDALDRVVRTVDALGNASESDFDEAGRTVATRDAAGNETSFVFDSRDRVVEVHGPDGAVTFFEYDAAGRRTAMVDPVGRRTEYEHDLLGRVIVQRRFLDGAPLETLSEFDAQGNRTAVTDEAGRITRFRYDLLGRLTETEDPAGGVTRRDYDADSNMVRYVNAKGSAWEFDYDALSRVVAERDPLGHETLFLYDLNSNLVWKRDPKGQETVLAYDALNRLTRVDYADGQWAAFSFDENGNRTEIEGSDGQRVAQTFDELDRVRTITHSALHRQLSYEYTATGARSAFETRDLTNGFVERTSYEWDQAGRPVAIRPPTGDVVTYHYAPDGAREGATLPNGVDVGYQYDSLGRLVEMTYRDTDAREIAFFRYQYDTAGNRTSQVDTEGLTQYTYGALDRLVEAVYPDGSYEKFTWDQVGNRLTHEDADGITSYAYDQGDRLLATTGAKPSSFTWDHNGNMLSRTDPEGTVAYRWNARDRLVRVDLPDGASSLYRYLPESDLRFSVTDKTGAETRFLWDGSNVVEELGPTNGRLAAYIEGLGVDEHLGRVGADGAVHAYVADPLGTVRAVVDSSGQIQNAYAYKAFGDTRAAVEGLAQPYRFTGRAFEPDTGEYYYRARYYQPGLGRFGASDPFQPWQQTYRYGFGNPVMYSDPSGQLGSGRYDFGRHTISGEEVVVGPINLLGWTIDSQQIRLSVRVLGASRDVPIPLIAKSSFAFLRDLAFGLQIGGAGGAGGGAAAAIVCVAGGGVLGLDRGTVVSIAVTSTQAGALAGATVGVVDGTLTALSEAAAAPGDGGEPCPSGAGGGQPDTSGHGNVDGGEASVDSALEKADEWLGPNYVEHPSKPGLFRRVLKEGSQEEGRQFRMTTNDLTDRRLGPHVHFEAIGPDGRTIIENSHVRLVDR